MTEPRDAEPSTTEPSNAEPRTAAASDITATAARPAPQTPAEAGVPSDNTTLLAVLAAMEGRGFAGHLTVTDDARVRCDACEGESDPADVAIDSWRRLEGASDPDDMMTVSAVACPACGSRGTIVVAFGPMASAADQDVGAAFAASRSSD